LVLAEPDAYVELHPVLARRLDLRSSAPVRLRTLRGCGVFRARITDTIRPDTVFVPFHWGRKSA
jgi:assimilatory nitrate reductase catalytic subunit